MKKVRIYILTRGRVGRQKTLEELPKQLHKYVRVVCPHDEFAAHVDDFKSKDILCGVISQPKQVKTLIQKRKWVAEGAAKAGLAFIMMDDDLSIRASKDGKYVNDPKAQLRGWKWMFEALTNGEADVVGFGTKAFSQEYLKMDKPLRYNYHLGFCFGMTPTASKAVVWDRIPLFEDIDYTLQLFAKGFHNILSYHNVVEQPKGEKPGGLGKERTDEKVEQSLQKLIKLHPGIVVEKEASARHSMSRTRIGWMKAAKQGGCKLKAEEDGTEVRAAPKRRKDISRPGVRKGRA